MSRGPRPGRKPGSRLPRIQAAMDRAEARRAGTMPDAAGTMPSATENDVGDENDAEGVLASEAQGRTTRNAPVGYRPRPARTTVRERREQVHPMFAPFLKPNGDEEDGR